MLMECQGWRILEVLSVDKDTPAIQTKYNSLLEPKSGHDWISDESLFILLSLVCHSFACSPTLEHQNLAWDVNLLLNIFVPDQPEMLWDAMW